MVHNKEDLKQYEKEGLENAVGVFAGRVSMCWTKIDKAGTFKSNEALDLVEDFIEYLKEKVLDNGA